MESIRHIAEALEREIYLNSRPEKERPTIIRAMAMQLFNHEELCVALNAWGASIGLDSESQITDDFKQWFAQAALQCASHPEAKTTPSKAVKETAQEERVFVERSYEGNKEDSLPEPPTYNPLMQRSEDFLKTIKNYMDLTALWYEKRAAPMYMQRRTLDRHLIWLTWALVEGLNGREIADLDHKTRDVSSRQADGGRVLSTDAAGIESVTEQNVNKVLWTSKNALARIIGLRRNPA
ncbi:hypothetical protein [Deinococcus rubellus]|uniref:Uncharacterized protein n=1 Tax=Deinococcus rubellus TaxID=1889240 RepID=A0ABY5YMR2_9DEIO|nr:hypothetical protein [Deinococcus rubellus]UWX65048.1 hypothetical protein N0D28_05165 [Deinococcus rubellus]